MSNFFTRATIILTAIYFVVSFIVAQIYYIDILSNFHTILFELCVCIYCNSNKKYHCRYIRRLSICVLLIDFTSKIDNVFNFLSNSAHNLIPIYLIALLTLAEFIKSLRHYIKVYKLKNRKYGKSD